MLSFRKLSADLLGLCGPVLSLALAVSAAELVAVQLGYPALRAAGDSVPAQLLTLYSTVALPPLLACGGAALVAWVLGLKVSRRLALAAAVLLVSAPLLSWFGVSLVREVYPQPKAVPSSLPATLRTIALASGPVLGLILAWLLSRFAVLPVGRLRRSWAVLLILLVPGGLLLPCAYSFTLSSASPRDALLLPPGDEAPLAGSPLVLVTVDTLRADHMSLYGYPRETSPGLDEWSEDATVFDQCVTTKTSTAPALASLHTGLYVDAHRVLRNGFPLDEKVITLAERLSQAGYHCVGFAPNFPGHKRGLRQGFHEWYQFGRLPGTAEKVFSAASDWIAKTREKKYFVWVHVVDPHTPYVPPAPWDLMFWGDEHSERYRSVRYRLVKGSTGLGQVNPKTLFGKLWVEGAVPRELLQRADYFVARYDGAIAFTDHWARSFLDAARSRDPRSLIVFTADHGESMVEHDYFFFHGRFCYEPTAHIPLMVRVPGSPAGRVGDRLVTLPDLFPTLCDLLGLSPPPCLEGRSFADVWFPALERGDGPVRSGVAMTARSSLIYPVRALRTTRWKLILNARRKLAPLDLLLARQLRTRSSGRLLGDHLFRSDEVELYDLLADPGESRNVADANPEVVAELRKILDVEFQRQFLDALGLGLISRAEAMDEADIEELRGLGYLR